jgi:alkylhydroperoxidase family enzyme
MRQGLTAGDVDAALGDLDAAALPAATLAALRLADRLTDARPAVDAGLYAELRRHFDDGQILALGAALSVASGWQRFIEAFGIRPDSWTEATPMPWRRPEDAASGGVAATDNRRTAGSSP